MEFSDQILDISKFYFSLILQKNSVSWRIIFAISLIFINWCPTLDTHYLLLLIHSIYIFKNAVLSILSEPEPEFKKFEPRRRTAQNLFQLSAGSNLKTRIIISSWTNSLKSASDPIILISTAFSSACENWIVNWINPNQIFNSIRCFWKEKCW